MRLFALLLLGLLLAALAGCSGSNSPPANGSDTGSSTTGPTTGTTGPTTGTGAPGAVVGNDTTLSCTVATGGPGNGYAGAGGQNVGGCSFTGKKGIDSKGTVKSMAPAAGCTVWYAKNASGTSSDGNAEAGKEYPAGTDFGVYCDPTMAPNSGSSIIVTLQP